MKPLRIGMYIGSWPQNIGNAFFDFGAWSIMKMAFPNAILYPTGGAVHWMFNASREHNQKKIFRNPFNRFSEQQNSFEIGEAAELDVLVFAGMSMCEEFVINNGKTFKEAASRGVAVLGLGAGAALYTDRESQIFSHFLNSLGKAAIITRDDDTYELFSGKISLLTSGIDTAFFLPDYFSPPRLALPPYDAVCFDGDEKVPPIEGLLEKVIHTHHDLWGYLPESYMQGKSTLVSDVPQDYLTIYSQAHATYSNRVHACLATLAYGNQAKLYSNTPRRSLFKKVGIESITEKVSSLNMPLLERLKTQQVEMARELVLRLTN